MDGEGKTARGPVLEEGTRMEPSNAGLNRIDQVCIVVRDLDKAMERFWKILGIGPWSVHTAGNPPYRPEYRGRPTSYRVRIGVAHAGPVILELVQYLEGESVMRDFLEEHGEGLQHIRLSVPDLDEALAYFKQHGIEPLQVDEGLGLKGDGRHAYMDTVPLFGAILELSQPASERIVERTYP